MADKRHLKLNNKPDRAVRFKYKTRGRSEEEVVIPLAQNIAFLLSNSLRVFQRDRETRHRRKLKKLKVPYNIDHIEIYFRHQFDTLTYGNGYLNDFGLYPVKLTQFNSKVLFAIVDDSKFNNFIKKLEQYIEANQNSDDSIRFDFRLKYIKRFEFLTTRKILRISNLLPVVKLELIEDLYLSEQTEQIRKALFRFLQRQNIKYFISRNEEGNFIELVNPRISLLRFIADNYDVLHKVSSVGSAIIGPSSLGFAKRAYGFDISNSHENLPLIGIIDTGISDNTPLNSILVNDKLLDITGTGNGTDNVDHGTAVAALASLGKAAYLSDYRGTFESDAKLLSLKVLDSESAALSDAQVIGLIEDAIERYPQVKIFTLTIGYSMHKRNNEEISTYAYELDKLAHNKNVLICICSSNNGDAANDNTDYNLGYFYEEKTNICTPAESMNCITVGAAADNLFPVAFYGISELRDFPALYTRKHNIEQSDYYPINKINRHLNKPDVIHAGGDYEQGTGFIGQGEKASMKLLSSDLKNRLFYHIGTSFSTPLIANLAAKILREYPDLRTQTVKALIINAATDDNIVVRNDIQKLVNKVIGNGYVIDKSALYSDENSVTIYHEQEIEPDKIIGIPIKLPPYLRKLDKKVGIVKVNATLCFSFLPVKDNQLAYCPIHMGFSVFRNKPLSEIVENYDDSILKERWSQDGYYKSKPMMYSNTQKISFSISRQDLIDEGDEFKIAVNCRINPQIPQGIIDKYSGSHKFSLVVRLEERLPESKLTGNLYDTLSAINTTDAILEAESD